LIKWLKWYAILVVVVVIGVVVVEHIPGELFVADHAAQPASPRPVPAVAKAPAVIDNRVFNTEITPPYKAVFDFEVGLVDGRLPTEAELRAVAAPVIARWSRQVKRVFVSFWLPGMEYPGRPFAVAEDTGEKRVIIYPGALERYCAYRPLLSPEQVLWPEVACLPLRGDLTQQWRNYQNR